MIPFLYSVVEVIKHRIVEYITVLTVDGEYLLTLERTGDFEGNLRKDAAYHPCPLLIPSPSLPFSTR